MINPERRGSGSAPGCVPRSTGSSIWTRLFPKEAAAGPERKRGFESAGKIKFTTQDHRFLKALKIAVDDESR